MPMTDRECFSRIMRYQTADRIPLHLVGAWPDTLARWHNEGLPKDVDVHTFLGVQSMQSKYIGCNTGLYPPFETRVLEENDECVITVDTYGRKVRDFKNHTSMPEWIEFPVKTPADLRRLMDEHYQLDPIAARFPANWEQQVRAAEQSGAVMIIDGGCAYGTLRNLAGVEYSSYLFFDAPQLVHEWFERYFTVVMAGIRQAARWTHECVLGFGEDIAFKTAPLISPELFGQFLYPGHKTAMELARGFGMDLTWYDSDGGIRLLMPQYFDLGINTFAPCEVAANMAPVALRRQFGRQIRMLGGLDKREIAKGKTAIAAEIQRNLPVIREGGYIPAIDHSVSADISFDNYRYYVEMMEKVLAG